MRLLGVLSTHSKPSAQHSCFRVKARSAQGSEHTATPPSESPDVQPPSQTPLFVLVARSLITSPVPCCSLFNLGSSPAKFATYSGSS